MDVVTGISGSSSAYVYMFIEAMADAVVAERMPRAQAYQFANTTEYKGEHKYAFRITPDWYNINKELWFNDSNRHYSSYCSWYETC